VPSVPLELGSEAVLVARRRADDTSIVERGEEFYLPSYLNLNVSLRTREVYLIPGQETRFALRGRNLLGVTGPDPAWPASPTRWHRRRCSSSWSTPTDAQAFPLLLQLTFALDAGRHGCSSKNDDDGNSVTVGLLLPFTARPRPRPATSSAPLCTRKGVSIKVGIGGKKLRILSKDTHRTRRAPYTLLTI